MYLIARKNKESGEYHPNFVETVVRITELQTSQGGDSSSTNLDTDPLTQVLGKDKSGRTRGVGSSVSKTKYKATRPCVSLMEQLQTKIVSTYSKLNKLLNFLNLQGQGQGTQDMNIPSPGTGGSVGMKGFVAAEASSHPVMSSNYSSLMAQNDYYQVRDKKNVKYVGLVQLETLKPGTIVHSRPLRAPEAKVILLSIYPNCDNEPVYLGQQGGATTLGDFGEGSFFTWPLYLLEKVCG